MASQVQYRRGTNAQNAAFTGALAEITVDTTNGTLRVHDGITAGGSNIATVSYVTAQIGALSANSISSGTSNVRVVSSGGNVTTGVGGTANVMVVATTGVFVTGDISATGNVTAANINSFNADLAEMYVADANYLPGTVVEFGGHYEITASGQSHSTRVAGIVSTNPSYLMNADQAGEHVIAVALVGRVPCQVTGTITKGDRLVASDIPGTAQRLNPDQYEPACIIGKALEAYNSDQIGTIEVAVGRT
jgi:hypothetical protein